MSNASQQIVNKAWNFAHVLRDDGLSYMAYTEQITFLLFLKMADEQTRPPYSRALIVPPALGWELVANIGRLCIMNLYLHGIDADPYPVRSGADTRHSSRITPHQSRFSGLGERDIEHRLRETLRVARGGYDELIGHAAFTRKIELRHQCRVTLVA